MNFVEHLYIYRNFHLKLLAIRKWIQKSILYAKLNPLYFDWSGSKYVWILRKQPDPPVLGL